MHPRIRKFIGAIALLFYLIAYSLVAMAAAYFLQIRNAGWFAEFAYYVVAGLAWVPFAAIIVWWMQKGPRMAG